MYKMTKKSCEREKKVICDTPIDQYYLTQVLPIKYKISIRVKKKSLQSKDSKKACLCSIKNSNKITTIIQFQYKE